ncbi:protein KINESIN LIGHT CHAIN-RELATED 2-like [Dioscorea cayenensis subsp. rotundata]|uniref:Protein KINESIN LIGHT CHAIN-RELATED 2-like n=1 Tax=Dioscorea cayennensis subsp. rotundata TaxID=55577 RepID=A0AB40BDW8_DIOCR|nr:protein KINESIN LIGHT CHAIN-RELATED 2-like [Dioscorea cayenensis subsp. rotundata]
MPGVIVNGIHSENLSLAKSPMTTVSFQSEAIDMLAENHADASIEQLYDNVCEMESYGDGSFSQESFSSDAEESRIDSELCHLVGGNMNTVEIVEDEDQRMNNVVAQRENGSLRLKSEKKSNKIKMSPLKSDGIVGKKKNFSIREVKLQNGNEVASEVGFDKPEIGLSLLKHARELLSSANPRRALRYALQASKSLEKCACGKPSLNLVMSLHVIAAIHCKLRQYEQAIPVLKKSLQIPVLEHGQDHALAKFSGYMQLGDTYAMMGQLENSLQCYTKGLEIQKQTLGDRDTRVGETCRYLAEANVQALKFDEAERLCQMALDIHKENVAPFSLEETADRRLMGLICDSKGNHEIALEHFSLASMAIASGGQEIDVAYVDCSIGDVYLSLARYDEAIFAYQKAASVFKSIKGDNHPTVASVFVRLADLYNKIGTHKESKSYCENALKIYGKPLPGTMPEEIATGLTDISAVYESINEHEEALKLLKRALKIYNNAPGHQSTIAGIEAQMGALYYITRNYGESYNSFKNAIAKLRTCGEKKSAFFGIALNQMGLSCVQRNALSEAAGLFEEARNILVEEYGPYHPDTLGVYCNLAGSYDAMGRLDEAIEILEYVVGIREEKLGTANPVVDDEKRRLAELLKEAGKVRSRKARSLETLLDTNPYILKKDFIAS